MISCAKFSTDTSTETVLIKYLKKYSKIYCSHERKSFILKKWRGYKIESPLLTLNRICFTITHKYSESKTTLKEIVITVKNYENIIKMTKTKKLQDLYDIIFNDLRSYCCIKWGFRRLFRLFLIDILVCSQVLLHQLIKKIISILICSLVRTFDKHLDKKIKRLKLKDRWPDKYILWMAVKLS